MSPAQFLYDVMIRAYWVGIALASPFKSKASKWMDGRRAWRDELRTWKAESDAEVIWVHAASLGEFEQGRPVIDKLRSRYPGYRIVLSFFSPSGYEVRKNYDGVDKVCYLPLDTARNAKDFIGLLNPKVAIFVKYEFWFNHLKELSRRGIPVLLVSGRLHTKQGFFRPWGGFFRKGLNAFEHFFLQDENSASLLKEIGFENFTVNGDTRFDRVIALQSESKEFPVVAQFCAGAPVVMVGSSWPYDEILMLKFINSHKHLDFKVVFAPHEIDEKRMDEFIAKCEMPAVRYSSISDTAEESVRVLFIDSIGMLSYLYRYCDVALIGGGFGAGIHNTLEAAVWSKPLVFGPRYQMFREALDLVEEGAAFSVETQEELDSILVKLLHGPGLVAELAGQKAWRYCEVNKGATETVMLHLDHLLRHE